MTHDELIREYLAQGGKVTRCPPGSAVRSTGLRVVPPPAVDRRKFNNPWWVRGTWHIVAVPTADIADAERWLRKREVEFHTTFSAAHGLHNVRMSDARQATLFKLTWGASRTGKS